MSKLLKTEEAARYLKSRGAPFTKSTLTVWRSYRRGPDFKRVAGRVFYEKTDLDTFLKGKKIQLRA